MTTACDVITVLPCVTTCDVITVRLRLTMCDVITVRPCATDGYLAQGSSQFNHPALDGGYPASDSGTSMGHDSYGDVEYGKIHDIYFPTVSDPCSVARLAPVPCERRKAERRAGLSLSSLVAELRLRSTYFGFKTLGILFVLIMANIGAAPEAAGTHRIPPAWTPGNDYTFRDWERDLENWIDMTDLNYEQIGPAVFQRLGGMAKILAREIPRELIRRGEPDPARPGGPPLRTGVQLLLNALRGRWGQEAQDRQLSLLQAFEEFEVGPREDYEDAITRFDIIRTQARHEANHHASVTSLARKLLLAFNVPEEQWANLLTPTGGLLPANDEEYDNFITHLRRNLALFVRRYNIQRPSPIRALQGQGHHLATTTSRSSASSAYTWARSDGGHWQRNEAPSPPTPPSASILGRSSLFNAGSMSSAYNTARSSTCADCGGGLSCVTCGDYFYDDELDLMESDDDSDDDLDFDNPDFQNEAELAYLEYENAAANWDNFMLNADADEVYDVFLATARRWNKFRKFGRRRRDYNRHQHQHRGHGHDRHRQRKPFRTSSRFKFAPQRRGHYMAGKRNPVGKDGNVLKCSICNSEEHLRAFCPKKKKKFGMGGGGKPRPGHQAQAQSASSSSGPFLMMEHPPPSSSASASLTSSIPSSRSAWHWTRTSSSSTAQQGWQYFCRDAASISATSATTPTPAFPTPAQASRDIWTVDLHHARPTVSAPSISMPPAPPTAPPRLDIERTPFVAAPPAHPPQVERSLFPTIYTDKWTFISSKTEDFDHAKQSSVQIFDMTNDDDFCQVCFSHLDGGGTVCTICGCQCCGSCVKITNGNMVCEFCFHKRFDNDVFVTCEDWTELRIPGKTVNSYSANPHSSSQLPGDREGLLVDCGAIDNLVGSDFVRRQTKIARKAGHDTTFNKLLNPFRVNGVGRGSQFASEEAVVPVHINGNTGSYRAPVLTDDGAHVPALWGLRNQRQQRAIIDAGGNCVLIPGPGGFKIHLSPGSQVIKCEYAHSGHMMIPVSDFGDIPHQDAVTTAQQWLVYGTTGDEGSNPSPQPTH